jgi:APA family basic amino acid/polyamine antiporter
MTFSNLFRTKSLQNMMREASDSPHDDASPHSLKRHLGVLDLTAFGIAAIVGAGIFSTIGKASAMAGPAVILLFIGTAIACSFAAFAYAEFASHAPVSGSAYTYSYLTFGELFAWIIGWALIMEYAIGNIVVAISWSDYFTSLVNNTTPWHIPEWLTMDFRTAHRAYDTVMTALAGGQSLDALKSNPDVGEIAVNGYLAWLNAPKLGAMHLVFDAPALFINIIITWLVYRGIKESRNASNIMVIIKLSVVLLVIAVGAFYVDTSNWSPFMPNGVGGILAGISSVFFAYIGFDAISTTAEECKNPQRDLPRGILYSIVICTVLYIIIALVVTGMVSYKELNVGDPLAYVFGKVGGLQWMSGIIAVSAVVAMASVLLVFQLGQPRIWMSMSRDGLLPPAFSKIHPRYQTPSFATIVTGLLVGIPTLFLDMSFVVDMCSVGTLFAFVLVCAGVLQLDKISTPSKGKFKTPYVNAQFIVPLLFVITVAYMAYSGAFASLWQEGVHAIPMFIFMLVFAAVSYLSFINQYSLIPVLGLLSCLYMMSQLGASNWLGFGIWLFIGLIIYFGYGYKHSKLNRATL